ncbi:MAG TPA: hypothetical protein DEB64_02625 [Alistipes sp.]|uniref:hypothetical protein n=1 Tax=Alistipes sp. UBA6068 TaxID=1946012 RepID=UPI000E83A1AE|nr:hypothetical protein [Alistipes sp. UBA6068]HBV49681.1 hypothetical protein [Alistipes sp.]
MNLKEIRNELRKLSALAEGWSSLQEIAPVERDMALEKLRDLYEALRFSLVPRSVVGRVLPQRAASEAPHRASRVVAPGVRVAPYDEEDSEFEMVDLSEVLSLGEEEPEVSAREEAVYAAESAARRVPAPEEEPEDAYEEGPEIIEFEPEPEHSRPARRPVRRPVRQPEPEPFSEEFPAEAEPAPEPFEEPFVEPEEPIRRHAAAAEEPIPHLHAGQSHAGQPPVAEPAARPTAAGQPQYSQPSQPEPVAAQPAQPSEPESEPAPTLFGDEDEATLRHRHKQRVIRALYDSTPAASSAIPQTEPKAAPKPAAEPIAPVEEPAAPEPEPIVPAEEPESLQAGPETEIVLLDALTEEPVKAHRADAEAPEESAPQVLGEVINHDMQTLADTIAPLGNGSGRYAAPISDLRQAIGINDKFLMIRDLFGGDGALFDSTVEALNAQETLDDCMIYIAEHFAWNSESDSAALIMELLERKFA